MGKESNSCIYLINCIDVSSVFKEESQRLFIVGYVNRFPADSVRQLNVGSVIQQKLNVFSCKSETNALLIIGTVTAGNT